MDLLFYSIYASEYNKETLVSLKTDFTIDEFLNHKQFIEIQEDLAAEARTSEKGS